MLLLNVAKGVEHLHEQRIAPFFQVCLREFSELARLVAEVRGAGPASVLCADALPPLLELLLDQLEPIERRHRLGRLLCRQNCSFPACSKNNGRRLTEFGLLGSLWVLHSQRSPHSSRSASCLYTALLTLGTYSPLRPASGNFGAAFIKCFAKMFAF